MILVEIFFWFASFTSVQLLSNMKTFWWLSIDTSQLVGRKEVKIRSISKLRVHNFGEKKKVQTRKLFYEFIFYFMSKFAEKKRTKR